jgi:hypothetical protein
MTETTMEPDYRTRLRSLRNRAAVRGIGVLTSRRAVSADNHGGLMLTDMAANAVISGARFDMSLDDAEAYLAQVIADAEAHRVR